MRRLIDCGANKGGAIGKVGSHFGPFDQIDCFECNPAFKEFLADREGVVFHEKAVWIEYNQLEFFLGTKKRLNGSSTLCKNKKSGRIDYEQPILVEAIDIADWTRKSCRKEDFNVLKLDIEGAEYAVLQRLFDTETIDYYDVVLCEFHRDRITTPGMRDRHRSVRALLGAAHAEGKLVFKKWR
jgi:FkbM family methyltransferase